jgi:chromosomal replication initiation ATPase DnaA
VTYTLSPDDIIRCRAISMRYHDRVKEIALAVCADTAIPVSAIYGQSRRRHIVEARHLVMYLAVSDGLSPGDVGVALNRDRTTVMHGCAREVARRMESAKAASFS